MTAIEERKELEKRGIFTFVSTKDRDSVVEAMRGRGVYAEPLGDAMAIFSRDPKKIEKYKKIEEMVAGTLGRMVKEGKIRKKGKMYKVI